MEKDIKASSYQVSGDHYRKFAIQPSEFCQRNGLGWCESNAVKYVSRWRDKNGEQDIDKAIHYLQLLKEWEFPKPSVRPFDLAAQGKLPAGFGPFTSHDTDGADNCANHSAMCVDCYNCTDYAKIPTPLSLCAVCAKADISCPVYPQETQHCVEFRDKVEREPLDLTLPSITQEGDLADVMAKFNEEVKEWRTAEYGSVAELIEAWDCQQASQTYRERGGHAPSLPHDISTWITDCYNAGRPVMQAKRIMKIKNAARGKYSNADCARILADV